MPSVTLHMIKGRAPEERKALLDAVHAALVESFRIPENDRFQRVLQYEPGDFEFPPEKSDKFLFVELSVFPGRSLEAKRGLYKGIVDSLEALGMDRGDVMILLHEPPMENWGLRGGVPGSEVKLGFKLDV